MAIVKELLRKEADGSLSFGDYTLPEKKKLADFECNGASYKVKTYKDITKLEKDGEFVYESTPGTAVNVFKAAEDTVSFFVDGMGDTQVTIGVEPDTEYSVTVDDEDLGTMKTNLGGKLTVGIEMEAGVAKEVKISKN